MKYIKYFIQFIFATFSLIIFKILGPSVSSNISGKIPEVNDNIPEPKLGINFKILEADHRKIHKVLVSRGES